MIDVHCHLNLHAFDKDYDEAITRAITAGVTIIVNTGTSIPSSRRAVELAQQYEQLYAIVGIHPHHADKTDKEFEGELPEDWLAELKSLAQMPKVIGIGEIGMDYYRYKSNGIVEKKLQEDVFRKQIDLCLELGLPLQIHNRHAGEDVVRILSDYKNKFQDPPGMFHCFAGSVEVLKDALDMGFYIGFDGNSTYKGLAPGETVSLPDLILHTPLERILVETDSPFLTPVPLRGTRNEPANAVFVAEFIAKTRSIAYNELEAHIHQNFEAVFGKKLSV